MRLANLHVIAVVDVLLVDEVGADALGAEASPQRVQVLAMKLGRELVHELVGVLAEQEQLALMRLGHRVTLEAIL